MRWLTDCSPATVAEAVRMVAPQLSGAPIEFPRKIEQGHPHRTPAAWIDDLSTRFEELGIG